MINSSPADANILFEKKPARSFEEAYPLGNGWLGAMIYGKTDKEIISLNHDTLWSGYPRGNKTRGQLFDSLQKAKKAVRDKDYLLADKELSDNFSCYASDGYLPMCDLEITFDKTNDNEKTCNYKRKLDLRRAVFSSTYRKGVRKFRTVAFISSPDKALFYKCECLSGKTDIGITLSSQLWSKTETDVTSLRKSGGFSAADIRLSGQATVNSQQNVERTDRKNIYGNGSVEENGMKFICAASVISDGKITLNGNSVSVRDCTFAEIRLTASTSFAGYARHPFSEGRDCLTEVKNALSYADSVTFSDAKKKHIKDYAKYYSRVSVNTGSSRKSNVPTSERLVSFSKGEQDISLPVLLFNFGRYLTVCASRPGTQAMNLQGIWNDKFFAPWHSNYTVNINTEMNYFPTLAVNLAEMQEPLNKMVVELADNGKITAKKFYRSNGWVCHHNTDIWRHTQPVSGMACYLFWNVSGAWLCRHLYDYYLYTLDNSFLKSTAYPVIRESVRFYLSQLEDSDDGYRIIFPSTSPENRYKYREGLTAVSETAEMTMSAVRELFGNYLKTVSILNISDDLTAQVREEYPRLRPIMIGKDGRILEWYGEHEESEIRHRHISHLYALHPGTEITPLKTPQLAEACKKTLAARGDESTGWSIAWKTNMYARLWDGEHALSLLKIQLRPCLSTGVNMTNSGGTYPNMFCAHPPFQIDGNFGATSAIAEMLIQSDENSVFLLPAMPSEWKNLSFKGLCAKGRRTVSLIRENGVTLFCKITGSQPERIFLEGNDVTAKFKREGNASIFRFTDDV